MHLTNWLAAVITAQFIIIILIAGICLKANQILPFKGLYLLTTGFLCNAAHIACIFLIRFSPDTTSSNTFLVGLDYFFHSIWPFFFVFAFARAKRMRKINRAWLKGFNITIFVIVLSGLLFSSNPGSRLFENALILYSTTSLMLLALFFYDDDSIKEYAARYYIAIAYTLWAVIRLSDIFQWTDGINQELYRATLILISKLTIFVGFLDWCIDFARDSVKSRVKEEQEKKHNKKFQEVIKTAFHEITLPTNDLATSLADLQKFTTKDGKSKYKSVQTNFERMNAIISVAKNTYFVFADDHQRNLQAHGRDTLSVVSVNTLIETAISSVRNRFPNTVFYPEYSSRCQIECNAKEVIQVFVNLFKNAVEAYGPDVTAEISVRSFVNKNSAPKTVLVEIENYGPNILPEIQEKIWESGFSTKMADQLNVVRGQGMYIVRKLIGKIEGGAIFLQSPIHKKDGSVADGVKFILNFGPQAVLENLN